MTSLLLAWWSLGLAADLPPEDVTPPSEESSMPAALLPTLDGEDPHAWLEEVLGDEALDKVEGWNEATLAEMGAGEIDGS